MKTSTIKPSGDDLTSAIAGITSMSKKKTSETSTKAILAALQKEHPGWKLNERRVSKYYKKLKKYQQKKIDTDVPPEVEDDDVSVASSTSNASAAARRVLGMSASIRKSLSLRKSPLKHDADEGTDSLTPDALAMGTNLLPQLEDDLLSLEDDSVKIESTGTSPTVESDSPKSADGLDELEYPSFVVEGDDAEGQQRKGESFMNIEIEAVVPDAVEVLNEDVVYKDDNDGKKEGIVCQGCVIL